MSDPASTAGSIAILKGSLAELGAWDELPTNYRYHANVLRDHLNDIQQSGVFDDIDHFFQLVSAYLAAKRRPIR